MLTGAKALAPGLGREEALIPGKCAQISPARR
jgi:hypothetical protein